MKGLRSEDQGGNPRRTRSPLHWKTHLKNNLLSETPWREARQRINRTPQPGGPREKGRGKGKVPRPLTSSPAGQTDYPLTNGNREGNREKKSGSGLSHLRQKFRSPRTKRSSLRIRKGRGQRGNERPLHDLPPPSSSSSKDRNVQEHNVPGNRTLEGRMGTMALTGQTSKP